MTFCRFSGDIYLSLGISLSCSFLVVSELLCFDILQTFVILSTTLLQTKSPVASAGFRVAFLKQFYVHLGKMVNNHGQDVFDYIYHFRF